MKPLDERPLSELDDEECEALVVFETCNVCGRKLHYCFEAAMGMCENCSSVES